MSKNIHYSEMIFKMLNLTQQLSTITIIHIMMILIAISSVGYIRAKRWILKATVIVIVRP